VLEINFRPETAIEFKAALQLVTTLASAEAEPEQPKTKPWKGSIAPTAPEVQRTTPADAAPAPAQEPAEFVTDDIPWPPSRQSARTYSRNDIVEALQDYARVNGAAALKEVLDRFDARRVSDIKPEHYAEVMTIARGELA
jgi:hypothetical protein